MAITIPERDYLTFAELQKRWQCSENDLRFAIICEELKPSFRIDPKSLSIQFDLDVFGDWKAYPTECFDIGYRLAITARKKWYFLQDPRQISPFDCEFEFAADDRDAKKIEGDCSFSFWFLLPEKLKIDDIKNNAVFLMVEIIRYEEKHGEATSNESIEKPLVNPKQDILPKEVAKIDDVDPSDLPEELAAANIAFNVVLNGYGDKSATFRNRLIDYLEKNFKAFNNEAVQRIATVANPDKGRGRKKSNTD